MAKPSTWIVAAPFVAAGLIWFSAQRDATVPVASTTVDFNRDIRPILSDHCYACHGADASKGRKAGLRLDTPEGARAKLESGMRAIVPGDLDASALIERINQTDPEEVMPPPEFKRPLTPAQREMLRRWVSEGAVYQPHWAFVPPAMPSAPVVKDSGWVRDPLDRHVLARIEQAGLRPSPEADRPTLLRRVSLALTGLQPTPEEVDAFVADTSPDAYERRVDAMLASKRHAEHLAVAWLDLARYADTAGYSGDPHMHLWPWRDWLLSALDRNLPYDQFVTWQLAGDLLPDATREQRLATTFNRLHRVTFEGGSIAEEMRKESISDRVVTFGFAFTALTLECARCHDHKYDPIPTRDFYALAAMFSDIDENGLLPYHGATPVPVLRLTTPEQDARATQLATATAQARRDYEAAAGSVEPPAGNVTTPTPAAHYPLDQLEKGATPNHAAGGKPATTDRHRADQLGKVALAPGKTGQAMTFDGDGGLWLDGLSGLTRHHPFTFSAWLRLGERNQRAALLHASGFYTNDADATGLELMLDDAHVTWSCIQQWPGSAISVRTLEPLPVGQWVQLTVSYDGLGQAGGLKVYADGRRMDCAVRRDHLTGPVGTATLELGSRSRDSGFRGGLMDEVRAWRDELTSAEVARLAGIEPSPADLREHGLRRSQRFIAAREALRGALRAEAALLDNIPAIPTMARNGHVRPTHVLVRGAYDQPDLARQIEPGAVEAVLPFASEFPRDRLGLARWVTSPQNPLAARVAVNRLWMQVFGQALVATPENFGVQGDAPSNPDLLDHLARSYSADWNTKALLRRLVLSATFRQSSAATTALVARDPSNLLLARGPSQRLTAEMLRDQALLASGLLVERFGGASAKPWQPPGLYGEAGSTAGEYAPDTGPNAHRRSVYTYRKRTVPPPNQQVFDAGSREVCQVRRLNTNTPLQTLALLNDPVYFECAQALARRAQREATDTRTRVIRAFRLLASRAPTENEVSALLRLQAEQQLAYARSPEEARKVCGQPDAELAALTLVCSTLLASEPTLVSR